MKSKKILIALFFILLSCEKKDVQKLKKLSFDQLFGKVITCNHKNINTKLFIYSPHMIGVPIKEGDFEFEYFHSIGSKLETNSVYYLSSFKGKSNFQTKQSITGKESRRLKITIKDGSLFVTAITRLDDKNIPINPVLYKCKAIGPISFGLP